MRGNPPSGRTFFPGNPLDPPLAGIIAIVGVEYIEIGHVLASNARSGRRPGRLLLIKYILLLFLGPPGRLFGVAISEVAIRRSKAPRAQGFNYTAKRKEYGEDAGFDVRRSRCQIAAIHGQRGAGHPRRFFACQIDGQSCDVLRVA